jgi:hypothetical protein
MNAHTSTVTNYNGWSNRETWLASLWLNNDEHSYQVLQKAISLDADDYEQAGWPQSRLHNQLVCEQGEASMWSDLLATAFHRIDWLEVISNNKI